MDLRIDEVKGHGDASEERVLLTVLNDCNLQYYMISDCTYSGSKISNKHRHSKWFSSLEVKSGDRVVLYTRVGKTNKTVSDSGVTWHKIFWNLKTPVWNDDGDGAILIRIRSWDTTSVK